MKKLLLAVVALSGALACFAQKDSIATEKVDTIRVGGMIIIKKKGKDENGKPNKNVVIRDSSYKKKENPNVKTNWGIVDLGFANYNDQTNYASTAAQSFAPGSTKDQFELRTGKSVNVNLWFFMQRINIIKHVVNLKYGLGLELNNYRFDDERIRLSKNPTIISLDATLKDVKKNKLAADYVTVPLMLNFNFTPGRKKGFGFSAGGSFGYLYSARQKLKDNDDKTKLHDNFDLRKWKVSYIGELSLGPVQLYGSYAVKSMWQKGLDQTPYAVGLRFGRL